MSHEEELDIHQSAERDLRRAAAWRRAVDDAHGSFSEELRKEPDWNATQRPDGTWAADDPPAMTIPEQAEKLVDDLLQAATDHERETVARKYTQEALREERAKVIAALVGVQRPEDVARAAAIADKHKAFRLALADENEKRDNLNAALMDRLRAAEAESIADDIRALPHAGQPEIEALRAEVVSKSEQIGKLYRVCNEYTVLKQKLNFLTEEIVDREGREGMTDHDFAEQIIALAQETRGWLSAAPASPRAEGE